MNTSGSKSIASTSTLKVSKHKKTLLSPREYLVGSEGITFNFLIAAITRSLTLQDDSGMLAYGRAGDIVSSRSCCLATLPEELTLPTLFGITHGNGYFCKNIHKAWASGVGFVPVFAK